MFSALKGNKEIYLCRQGEIFLGACEASDRTSAVVRLIDCVHMLQSGKT